MDDLVGGGKSIKAEVPLAEMSGLRFAASLFDAGPCYVHDGIQSTMLLKLPRNVAEAVIADKTK